jgi:hypothetical protein
MRANEFMPLPLFEEDFGRTEEIMPLEQYSYVRLVQPFHALPKGAEGTIVEVYPTTGTYMIEFFSPTRTVETVDMGMVEKTDG